MKKTNKMLRVVAIHDISCMGRCSLTVVLPILSSCGIETMVLPTALLSTHTSGFENYTNLDLTKEDVLISKHWEGYRREINAIYSGFLGSNGQIELLHNFIRDFKEENTIILIDPVMADNGSLYPIFNQDYAQRMTELSKKADILIPNVTEACIIAGIPYLGHLQTKESIEMLLNKLTSFGIKEVVLTSVAFEKDQIGVATISRNKEIKYYFHPQIKGYYHGTGDVFGSAFLAAYLNGFEIDQAAQISADYIATCIKKTIDDEDFDPKYGVNFELATVDLLKALKKVSS